MAANRQSPEHQAELIAAARAAVGWARSRRSTWTDVPLPVPTPLVAVSPMPAAPPPPMSPARPIPAGPSAAERAADFARDLSEPLLRWLPRVAIFAAVVAGAYYGIGYARDYFQTSRARSATASRAAKPQQPPPPSSNKSTGDLEVVSTPAGAQVIVDGRPRGATPVTVTDLKPGRHNVELRGESGTLQRTVTIEAGQTAQLDESIFSGFLAVYSPFDVVVTEGNRTLRFDDRNQVMMPSGAHELRIVSRALGYDVVEHVDVKPGETSRITVKPPPTPVTVTASEAAEVWLDGQRIGDAPVNAMPVDLGTHDIVVRRAGGGAEKRFTVTITVKPLTLNADFSR